MTNTKSAANAPDEDVRNAALDYVAQGIPVFPVMLWDGPDGKREKTPLVRWRDAATTDKDVAERWFNLTADDWPANNPRPNARLGIGIPTGAASGMTVLDFDVDANGEFLGNEEIKRIVGETGWTALQRMPRSRTQSGGVHIVCGYTPDMGTTSASRLAPSVDTRNDGGFIVVPGSPGYSWEVALKWRFWPKSLEHSSTRLRPPKNARPIARATDHETS